MGSLGPIRSALPPPPGGMLGAELTQSGGLPIAGADIPPLNREWVEKLIAEAQAAGRDCSVLRERAATYEARRIAGKSVTQMRQWLLSTVTELGKESQAEWERIEDNVRAWAGKNQRRTKHWAHICVKYGHVARGGHTIHWKATRGKRWLTLLGLPSLPMSKEPEVGSN